MGNKLLNYLVQLPLGGKVLVGVGVISLGVIINAMYEGYTIFQQLERERIEIDARKDICSLLDELDFQMSRGYSVSKAYCQQVLPDKETYCVVSRGECGNVVQDTLCTRIGDFCK